MRIEILRTEQEALDRIHQLRERGIRENQMSVIHDAYRDIPAVEERTGVDTIEVREDQRDESVFDRFVNWVSGRDTLDHLFNKFDVVQEDQHRYYEAVENGSILLAVEEDEEIADSYFRSAHVTDAPGTGPYVGTTEPIDPFIGGAHYPDGTPGTVSGDPYPGSVPEYDAERAAREYDEHSADADRDLRRAEEGLFSDRQDPEEYSNYRPLAHDADLGKADEHIYSKDERDPYVTRGDGPDNLRIDEPNYVNDDDLRGTPVRPPDSERPDLDRISEDSLSDYSEPRFEKGRPEDEFARREDRAQSDRPHEGDEHLHIREPNYVTDDDLRTEEERIHDRAIEEELGDDERRRYNDGEIAESDLQTPGEPLFGDGPRPEEVDDDGNPLHEGSIYHSDEDRLRRRDQGLINPDRDDRTADSMLETEEERLRREEAERRRDELM